MRVLGLLDRQNSTTFRSRVRDKFESLGARVDKTADKLNTWAAGNSIGRWFRFKERSATFTVECRAGFITFLMVSYVLAVNPNILITTGGTCNPQEVCTNYNTMGPACLGDTSDPGAQECLEALKTNLITATAASSLISTFVIGLFGNLPLALAPGVGISAYVAYQVIGAYGEGHLTYSETMTAIFVEGWIFILLSITGVRGGLVKFMPKNVAMASSVGIGLLLAFTGLGNLGVIAFEPNTLVGLGGCDQRDQTYIYSFPAPLNATAMQENVSSVIDFTNFPLPATVHGCGHGTMRSATMWLGISGGILMALLLFAGVKGALVIGILFVTVISWIPNHSASYLGSASAIEGGETRLELFKKVVAAPSLSMTGFAWDWSAFSKGHLYVAMITFLYIDLLDCTGTLLSMARLMDHVMPGFMNDQLEFPGQMWAFLSDGVGILTGSMMGTTSLTVYIESAAGIEDGGRTGLTAIVVSAFFFVSLFFSPILASIPPYATGPALVLVGTILLGHIAHIDWDDIGEAIPAFLTIILMPFTYSVAYGVIAGLASYIIIHLPYWLWDTLVRKAGKGDPDAPDKRLVKRLRTQMWHRKTYLSDGGGSRASLAGSYDGTLDQASYQSSLPPGPGGRGHSPVLNAVGLRALHQANSYPSLHTLQAVEVPGSMRGSAMGGLPLYRRSLSHSSPLQFLDVATRHGLRAPPPAAPSGLNGIFPNGELSQPTRSPKRVVRSISEAPSLLGRPPLPTGGGLAAAAAAAAARGGDSGPAPMLGGRTFHRSLTYSGPGGLAALVPDDGGGDIELRASSSFHEGTLYQDYAQGHEVAAPPATLQEAREVLRAKYAGWQPPTYRRQLSTSSTEANVEFSGGGFKLAPGSTQPPSPFSAPAMAAAAAAASREDRRRVPRGHRRQYSLQSSQAEPEPSFRLFGDVQLPSSEGEAPAAALDDKGSSFRLFGGVDLPTADSSGDEPPQEGAASFRLFGDVGPLPPADSGDAAAEQEQLPESQGSFRLFGDVGPLSPADSTLDDLQLGPAQTSFRLFGDVGPIDYPTVSSEQSLAGASSTRFSGDIAAMAAAVAAAHEAGTHQDEGEVGDERSGGEVEHLPESTAQQQPGTSTEHAPPPGGSISSAGAGRERGGAPGSEDGPIDCQQQQGQQQNGLDAGSGSRSHSSQAEGAPPPWQAPHAGPARPPAAPR
ncbi:hypothetical protein N2152v2_001223 [Parachlorella kessleri]